MIIKTVAHGNIKKAKLWRNLFMLYSAALATLYVVLSLTGNAEQASFYSSSSAPQADSAPSARITEASHGQISKTQLASN